MESVRLYVKLKTRDDAGAHSTSLAGVKLMLRRCADIRKLTPHLTTGRKAAQSIMVPWCTQSTFFATCQVVRGCEKAPLRINHPTVCRSKPGDAFEQNWRIAGEE